MANPTLKSITVGELIDLLQDQDRDARVIFTADYGDRSHTEQALPIRGEVEQTTITESAYSASGFALGGQDEDDDVETEYEAFVVIR